MSSGKARHCYGRMSRQTDRALKEHTTATSCNSRVLCEIRDAVDIASTALVNFIVRQMMEVSTASERDL